MLGGFFDQLAGRKTQGNAVNATSNTPRPLSNVTNNLRASDAVKNIRLARNNAAMIAKNVNQVRIPLNREPSDRILKNFTNDGFRNVNVMNKNTNKIFTGRPKNTNDGFKNANVNNTIRINKNTNRANGDYRTDKNVAKVNNILARLGVPRSPPPPANKPVIVPPEKPRFLDLKPLPAPASSIMAPVGKRTAFRVRQPRLGTVTVFLPSMSRKRVVGSMDKLIQHIAQHASGKFAFKDSRDEGCGSSTIAHILLWSLQRLHGDDSRVKEMFSSFRSGETPKSISFANGVPVRVVMKNAKRQSTSSPYSASNRKVHHARNNINSVNNASSSRRRNRNKNSNGWNHNTSWNNSNKSPMRR